MKKTPPNPSRSRPPIPKLALDPTRTLIVVDVQRPLRIPGSLVRRIDRFARGFTLRVFTLFVNRSGSLTQRLPGVDGLGTRAALRLQPQAGDWVIRKSSYGFSVAAIRRLKAAGVRRAWVCGVETDACVMGVMFSLFDNGIVPELVAELCWSSSGHGRAALKILRNQFPRLTGRVRKK